MFVSYFLDTLLLKNNRDTLQTALNLSCTHLTTHTHRLHKSTKYCSDMTLHRFNKKQKCQIHGNDKTHLGSFIVALKLLDRTFARIQPNSIV